jgi:hypothetical protein
LHLDRRGHRIEAATADELSNFVLDQRPRIHGAER